MSDDPIVDILMQGLDEVEAALEILSVEDPGNFKVNGTQKFDRNVMTRQIVFRNDSTASGADMSDSDGVETMQAMMLIKNALGG